MSPDAIAGHEHVFLEGAEPQARTLLLLHGTGGNEYDLMPVGRSLAPDANYLSPRGRVLENGMPRFFARHGEGNLDLDDLKQRAADLAEFVRESAGTYGFEPDRVIAVGYSNGANIATALLLRHADVLAGAVLARAMPFDLDATGTTDAPVLLLAGRRDPYTASPRSERLAEMLQKAGARVDVNWAEAGHELTPADVQRATEWLAKTQGVAP